MKNKIVKRTERGWAGHFCCAPNCMFRRNTLLEYNDIKIVVSTVGAMSSYKDNNSYETIGINRYYETMAFHAKFDEKFWDADVHKQINFDSPWAIDKLDAENEANDMHEKVVDEITKKLQNDDKFIATY